MRYTGFVSYSLFQTPINPERKSFKQLRNALLIISKGVCSRSVAYGQGKEYPVLLGLKVTVRIVEPLWLVGYS
ncbi:MAG: hypothetical protein F6J98_22995 [Moorea sp. SIO4G2]|nr:hypothetical protein [Moorena sp. SIO4G2]